jgi:hypothetical protein
MSKTEETHFEINCEMPFDKGQCYVVGYDTMGKGVRFDSCVFVCHNNDVLLSEIHRVIEKHDLSESDEISLEEQIIIAKLEETPNLNYREFTLRKEYRN